MEEQKVNQEPVGPGSPTPRVPAAPQPPVSGPLAPFESWLYEVLVAKAPYQLPVAFKDWIVRYGPWITLVIGVILALTIIPSLTAIFALTGYSATYGGMYGAAVVGSVIGPMFYVALAILALQLVIMFVSVPMLLKHQRKGWLLVFYSSVVSLAYTLVSSFSYGYFNFGSLLVGLISAAISMYVLFQIRSYYTK